MISLFLSNPFQSSNNDRLLIKNNAAESDIIKTIENDLSITAIAFKDCDITSPVWKVITSCQKLEVLILENSRFQIPQTIDKLETLKILNLTGSTIDQLPESIGNLKNLMSLDLSYTNIVSLPKSLDDSASLNSLNLMGCQHLASSTLRNLQEKHNLKIIYP